MPSSARQADFSKAIDLNPNPANAYANRGSVYFNKGQWDRCISDCTKAIEINPNCVEAYFNRGLAYKEQGKKAEAIFDFEKVISLTHNPQWIQEARQLIEELGE